MFFAYAEKQSLLGGWQLRQVAFDCTRRYMYYTTGGFKTDEIYVLEPPRELQEMTDTASSYNDAHTPLPQAEHVGMTPFGTQRTLVTEDSEAKPNENIKWKSKMKVSRIKWVTIERNLDVKDERVKELDLFQLEIHGDERPLLSGETPPVGPLLCPSASFGGLPDRFRENNEEYIRDPFFLRELYNSLRDLFDELKAERERTGAEAENPNLRTIASPRGKGEASKKSPVKVTLRFMSQYEFRRFGYVVQTVLGYDKLNVRPYYGLPPYDPRNGLIFGQIPMSLWTTFKSLDETVFYTIVRGNLVGRDSNGDLEVTLRGIYLCITHDMILLMRPTGAVCKWVHLKDIKAFYYNHTCYRPFVCFMCERPALDLTFVLQPPAYGEQAARSFNPKVETLRIHRILHATCFTSVAEARRVIHLHYTPEPSVRSFVEVYEDTAGRRLNFDSFVAASGGISCPLPKEQLAAVWEEVVAAFQENRESAGDRAAIPLYVDNTNDVSFTSEQVSALLRRLQRQRSSGDEIVGVSFTEAQREVAQVPARHSRSVSSDGGPPAAQPLDEAGARPALTAAQAAAPVRVAVPPAGVGLRTPYIPTHHDPTALCTSDGESTAENRSF
ncbi:hypothetical protein STCU_09788 [Strigomonas culicis]|uniref:Uncharacterized protein n=1 Tax=Strigomonas culicis TaxID=28005 RepID=S9TKM8_9TRYP|nr:hypothetical protein STCU_09788 [Strigomonas culicis]|eukprot:EPY18752.1 hypothetical protein STCU_09788 [Strigomonas culicis]